MNRKRVSAYFGSRDPVKGPHLGLKLHGKKSNVNVAQDFQQIESQVGPLSPALRDLVDLGAAVYLADMFTVPEISFYREIEIITEVRDIDTWGPLSGHIDNALSFLMQSPLHVEFIEGKADSLSNEDTTSTIGYDHVVCLSGGLDSYAGVLTLDKGSRILLVSQFNTPVIAGLQTKVATKLRDNMQNLSHLRANIGQGRKRKIGRRRLGSQRYAVQPSRSFMFLAVAGAAAITTHTPRLSMFENGPMALGIKYTPARFTTRTVHPVFLDMMQHILRGIPGAGSIVLDNPFQSLTKPEVVSRPPISKVIHGVRETCSCSIRWRVHILKSQIGRSHYRGWHCGWCLPCIHRRLSVLYAGCGEADDEYLVDVLREYPFTGLPEAIAGEAMINVRDFLAFLRHFRDKENAELFELFPNLYFETERLPPDDIVDMHKRLATQVFETIETHGNRRLRGDVFRIS